MDVGLKRELEDKVRSGERLTREDGIALYESDDLAWLGGLAHEVRARRHGDVVRFGVTRHLGAAGLCPAACGYCAFRRTAAGTRPLVLEDAVRLADGGTRLTELHLAGGAHPGLDWADYPRAVRAIKDALPGVALKGFTAAEIHRLETAFGLDASVILDELAAAGLDGLTGGGAEIFAEEVRRHAVDHGTAWEDWSRVHRLAHGKGLTSASTMVYGHLDEPEHRVDHVLRLRALQDETGGFEVFAPVLHRPGFAGMSDGAIRDRRRPGVRVPTGVEALKIFAVSRLLLDNVPHLAVFWAAHGVQTAQFALQHGADEIAGSVTDGEVTDGVDDVGVPHALSRDTLVEAVRDAGLRPAERDARYGVVREYDGPDPLRRESPQPMRV